MSEEFAEQDLPFEELAGLIRDNEEVEIPLEEFPKWMEEMRQKAANTETDGRLGCKREVKKYRTSDEVI